jgi:hypothetical protein
VAGDVPWERLDEDAVVEPDEVQLRVLGHDDGAAFDVLAVKGGDARAVLLTHPPKPVGDAIKIVRAKLAL